MKPTVSYGTFCCAKDKDRVLAIAKSSMESHAYPFDEKFFVFQRCDGEAPEGFKQLNISKEDYPSILHAFKIKYPDAVAEYITHGWDAPHFFAHHLVNHLKVLQNATSDYIAFSDGDCYIKEQPEGVSWIEEGIRILETNSKVFVVSPSDGRPDGGSDRMMSQQMFLINRKRFLEMEFIPWDGLFLDNGPFAPFYFLMEGVIYRYMVKYDFFRFVLPPQFRWWHLEFH